MAKFWSRSNEDNDAGKQTITWEELISLRQKRKPCYNVVAAVVCCDNEILCVQKGKTKYDYTSYRWEFPGGKMEEGEAPEQALHRELLEEMDYDVSVDELFCVVEHSYPDFDIVMSAYLCSASSRFLQLKEHADLRWLPIAELDKLDWCAADAPIVDALAKR